MKLFLFAAAAFLVPFVLAAPSAPRQSELAFTAHEWGTFTSVSAPDGTTMDWLPLAAANGLPNFVEHLQNTNFKGGLRGTIRMETPVLYFYSPQETTVSVHVAFSQGLITEWYPHAEVPAISPSRLFDAAQKNKDGAISWPSVEIDQSLLRRAPNLIRISRCRNFLRHAARKIPLLSWCLDRPAYPHRRHLHRWSGNSEQPTHGRRFDSHIACQTKIRSESTQRTHFSL
jgi:hypothetical protein